MLVCVTGGTGFVGSHTTAALLAAGHRVRLLARRPEAVGAVLGPLGAGAAGVDVVPGDVTDAAAVDAAVRGTDAVLHAASVYSFDPRRRAEIRRTNVRGTELVLDAARRHHVGRTVHVSSFGALLPAPERLLREDAPVGRPREPYLASKAAAELVARQHQERGEPVVITYPPGLHGPHDPRLGDQNRRLRDLLRGLMPIWPGGGFPIGDVRDTAAAHATLISSPAAAARQFTPGRYLTTREYLRAIRDATGRALPAVFLPARAMMPVGRLADAVQRVVPWHIPAEFGAIYTCAHACWHRPAGATAPRPLGETITDTVRWLHDHGAISGRAAGTTVRVLPENAPRQVS